MDVQQRLQEEQYDFPYHYIPSWDGERFSPHRYWAWSHHYLGGFEVAFNCLDGIEFGSLLDIGCGDGRFLEEARHRYPKVDMLGVDYSERAVTLARALNPEVSYEVLDVARDRLERQYDAATMIEVLEHIPPDRVPEFLRGVAANITPGGRLILTVPHSNKPLQSKHYQHFDSNRLRELLAPEFAVMEFLPFDRKSRWLSLMHRFVGGKGRHLVVTDRRVQTAFWNVYRSRYLFTTEDRCLRIAAVCRPRPRR